MKKLILSLLLLTVVSTSKAQFPGTDSLRNFNNRFITNEAMRAFTNLRLHNLLSGIIDFLDSANGGGSVSLGVDTLWVTADSIFHYRKNGVFRQFVIRGQQGAGDIYEVPFSNGAGRFANDSNFLFDQSQGSNNSRLIVGPTVINDGGLSKINATSDNMNAAAFTSFGTGTNTIIFRRSLGSVGLPLAITEGTDLWNFSGRGYTGSFYTGSRANIYSRTTQDWTDTTHGTKLVFSTTDNDSSTMKDRVTIDHDGAVYLHNYPNLPTVSDTTYAKPTVIDPSGRLIKFDHWPNVIKPNIDVFLIAGQSNAKGKGDSTLSPKAITGKVLQINTGVIKDANDPMGENVTGSNEKSQYGSAWPSFGNTYFNKTSRMICMIPSYKGGTAQCAAADVGAGNWDTTGVLFDSAVARVNSAMSVLATKGYNPIFKGVVWLQGENDAIALQAGTITQADYTAAFTKMIRKFRQNFGAAMPFNIIRVGTSTPYIDSYWQQIRDVQQSIANSDSMTQVVYYNAANFVTRGLMQGDGIHYNQIALNEVGQMTANAILTNNKNIWQPQEDDIYFANSGSVGIGGPPTESFNLEINTSKNSSAAGIKILNTNTGGGAFSTIRFYNNSGPLGFLYTTNSAASSYRPSAFTMFGGSTGGIVLSASAGDIIFSRLAQGSDGSTYGRYVRATTNYLFNTDTDNGANGKFQINSTSWFNGLMKLSGVTAPANDYNLLVHSKTDSGTYQLPVTAIPNFANSNLRFTTDRSHSGAGYSLLIDSTSSINLITRGLAFPSFLNKFSTLHMDGDVSNDPSNHTSLSTVYMNAANSLDSITMQLSLNSTFGAAIRYKNVSANQHSYVQVFKQRAVVSSDSVYISAIPATTADSVFAPLGYDATSKSRPVGVVPVLKFLKGSTTWQPGIVGAGSSASTTLTVTGAVTTDVVHVNKVTGGYSNGEIYDAWVSSSNTVTIRVHNVSTGSANYNTTETYNVILLKY